MKGRNLKPAKSRDWLNLDDDTKLSKEIDMQEMLSKTNVYQIAQDIFKNMEVDLVNNAENRTCMIYVLDEYEKRILEKLKDTHQEHPDRYLLTMFHDQVRTELSVLQQLELANGELNFFSMGQNIPIKKTGVDISTISLRALSKVNYLIDHLTINKRLKRSVSLSLGGYNDTE